MDCEATPFDARHAPIEEGLEGAELDLTSVEQRLSSLTLAANILLTQVRQKAYELKNNAQEGTGQ